MPVAMDRTNLVAGVATFTISVLDWIEPKVGNIDNNPNPSFVDNTITDIFFYKNRFGLASSDSIVLSNTASYEDFYIKTVVDILDTDPIDVAIASSTASKIYYVKPFNSSLYVFTKDSQFELTGEGFLSPKTVAINPVTDYPMATDVEPRVMNNSLFFVSKTGNRQQLREYIKNEKLSVEGVDLNISTPTYLDKDIKSILINGVLGFVICTTDTNEVYLYSYKEAGGGERVQGGWSRWNLLKDSNAISDSFEYFILDATLLVLYKTTTDYIYHTMQLDDKGKDRIDTTVDNTSLSYNSTILLPDFYPHAYAIGTPKDKMLIKKVSISGEGNFNASIYRKDYDKTYIKSHLDTSIQDLDIHIASRVGNVDITIGDETTKDFIINSIVIEGTYSPTSKQYK